MSMHRLFDLAEESMRWTAEDNYPTYNIEKVGDDRYAISLAVAGFSPDEITITAEQNTLTVEGRKAMRFKRRWHGDEEGSSGTPLR